MRIKGVISDMDGVILDSEKLYVRFWCEAARFYGYPMERRHALEIRSMARPLTRAKFRGWFGEDCDCDVIRVKRGELMDSYIEEHGIEAKAGAGELLAFLKENGIKTALATATPVEKAKRLLSTVGLLEYFDEVTSAKEVKNGKPAPDVYLFAASRLGLDPRECLALEDSPNGVRSASAAGCATVMVPDLDEPSEEIKPLLFAVAKNLSEVIKIVHESQ